MSYNKETNNNVHPYIPNTVPSIREQMLKEIGISSLENLHSAIPDSLKLKQKMNLPPAIKSEYLLKKHMNHLLNQNSSCFDLISFLGGGSYEHDVPAVCDEVCGRSEFLTAYAGEPYDDHGRFQTMFEYTSMMGELLNMEIVSVPVYDGFQASCTTLRMAKMLTQKKKVLVAGNINPDRLNMMRHYTDSVIEIQLVQFDSKTGCIDIKDLESKLGNDVAGVFFENPNFFGSVEDGKALCELAHKFNAKAIVCTDPITLSFLTPPADYGADIVCGDIQSLGINMQFGGGHGGYLACHDDEEVVNSLPCRLFGICPTKTDGEYGFGDVAYYRTSFDKREEGNEWVGTASALWGITAGVYLASLGPQGLEDLGNTIFAKTAYAKKQISLLPNVEIAFESASFREFVVDFTKTGKTVKEINLELIKKGFLGGHSLKNGFDIGEKALYCITECRTKEDIDGLCLALNQILNEGNKS